MNILEYVDFRRSLNLNYEEELSLDYSSGFFTYWEIYRNYKIRRAQERINEVLPLIGVIGVATIIIEQFKKQEGLK